MSYVLRAVIKNKLVLDSFLGGLFRKAVRLVFGQNVQAISMGF